MLKGIMSNIKKLSDKKNKLPFILPYKQLLFLSLYPQFEKNFKIPYFFLPIALDVKELKGNVNWYQMFCSCSALNAA
jgi:hypothetical protein